MDLSFFLGGGRRLETVIPVDASVVAVRRRKQTFFCRHISLAALRSKHCISLWAGLIRTAQKP